MPSFSDSIFLFILALLLFGPKKLPMLARELGKWVGEFRRASNEFKMQMEEELRASEQEDRRKQIAAMEAAAPVAPALPEPEHPHMPRPEVTTDHSDATLGDRAADSGTASSPVDAGVYPKAAEAAVETQSQPAKAPPLATEPLPIATSGDLRMMPPATGLPVPRGRSSAVPAHEPSSAEDTSSHSLDSLFASIPTGDSPHGDSVLNPAETTHGH